MYTRPHFDNARDKMKAIISWLDYQVYEITVLCDTIQKAEQLYDLFRKDRIFEFADTVWFGNEDPEYRKEAKKLRAEMQKILSPSK